MSDTDIPNRNSDASDIERLREIAVQIMIHLEGAHEAAMRAQAQGLNREGLQSGFDEVRSQIGAVEMLIIEASKVA